MSPRLLPETPSFESVAEETVWTALRDQLPDDAVLVANLGLVDRRGDCEADITVIWPGVGIAVIEVLVLYLLFNAQSSAFFKARAQNPA